MADKKPKTKLYRLTGRQHAGFDDDGNVKNFNTGDKVPLTESQYEAFKDKFEPLNAKDDEEEGQGDPKLSPELPATKVGVAADKVTTDADKAKAEAAGKPTSGATGAGAAQNSTSKQTVK